jgi:hypothetical protein
VTNKNREKIGDRLFVNFFENFSTHTFLFCCGAFGLPSLRNTKSENAINQKNRGKPDTEFFVDFFGKKFSQQILQWDDW